MAYSLPNPYHSHTHTITRIPLKPHPPTHHNNLMPPPPTSRKRKIPSLPSPTPLTSSASPYPDHDRETPEDHAEYAPPSSSKSKSGLNGGGGGGGGKMSREQLRKQNHSLIERRRREKINAAMGELRGMVPGLGEEGGKGGEFKLEVLERTVDHMKTLIARINDLEARLEGLGIVPQSPSETRNHDVDQAITRPTSPGLKPIIDRLPQSIKQSRTPPSISPSPSSDPNETEIEPNLPPPYTLSQPAPHTYQSHNYPHPTSRHPSHSRESSPPTPSLTSLLTLTHNLQLPPIRPLPSFQAANPTLYLPFPTPSPTSPFLTYHPHSPHPPSLSNTSSSSHIEPSPFIAPLQNISLFGGILNLDTLVLSGSGNAKGKQGGMEVEEAAELLLAFSSPDVLRPVGIGGGVMRRGAEDRKEEGKEGKEGEREMKRMMSFYWMVGLREVKEARLWKVA